MAVTFNTPQQIGPTDILYSWTSDLGGTPTFYLYLDGILIETTTRTYKQISMGWNETVQFEVLDDADTLPQPAYPARMNFAWYSTAGAVLRFRVDKYVDAAWAEQHMVTVNPNQSYFRDQTDVLEDGETHQYRIVPIGADNEREGLPLEFTFPMVRNPDKPTATFTWNQLTTQLTISASMG